MGKSEKKMQVIYRFCLLKKTEFGVFYITY